MKSNRISIILIVIALLAILTTFIEFVLVVSELVDETHFLYYTLLVSSLTVPLFLFTIGLLTYEKRNKNGK